MKAEPFMEAGTAAVDFPASPGQPGGAVESIPARTVWFMSVSVGLIVANGYYIQPLLADIARQFSLSVPAAGSIMMISQIGTALGMLFFVPLGDTHERRKLISALLVAAAASLVLFASAPNVVWLAVAAMAIGASAANIHVFLPLAAHLAPSRQRGRVLGAVLAGLLVGILLARTLSGYLGAHFGWRFVYWLAAGGMLLLFAMVRLFLPRSQPEISLTFGKLLKSIVDLARRHRALRESALLGALLFAVYSAFWTTLAFLLEAPPFHYGSEVAGLFGLVGAAGAAGAPWVGRLADRYGPRVTLGFSLLAVFAAFVWFGFFSRTLPGLVVGAILLDMGVQSGHVSNQTRIYGLAPEAKGRVNTFYMVTYFIGGALGSYLGAWAWRAARWPGVCALSALVIAVALLMFWHGSRTGISQPVAASPAASTGTP